MEKSTLTSEEMNIKKLINKNVKNAGWLMAGRILHMILAFVIGLMTARYLGPSNYGLVHYAASYTTFFTSICTLGINSIIVKNFVDYPDEEGVALGTTIVLRIISSTRRPSSGVLKNGTIIFIFEKPISFLAIAKA